MKFALSQITSLFAASLICGAPIVWEAAIDTVDPTVVVTEGTLVEAINGSGGAGVVTINGVTFSPSDAILPNPAATGMLSGQTTLDPGLDSLLTTVDFGGGSSTTTTIGGGNLVIGQAYQVQIFFMDLRSGTASRVMTYGDNLGSGADVSASGGAGSFGQNVTGVFTADDTSQTLSLLANGFGNAHINGYQIRTATAAPVIESFTATPAMIASGESSSLSWEITGADSAEIDSGVGVVSEDSGASVVMPGATTTYTLTASNAGGSVTEELTIGVDVVVLDPVISEFLTINDTGIETSDGETPDWIEIYNPNVFPIDLGGYFLTDDTIGALGADLQKWEFPPNTMLDGQSYIVVFASGVAQTTPELHANFKLDSDQGSISLVARDGSTVVSSFANYPSQRSDVSFGIGGFFPAPTPGSVNGSSFSGFVADTEFDVDRGFFDAPFTVTVSTATAGATISYTTDGSEPSLSNGILAGGSSVGLMISETTVLRAAAFRNGLGSTDIDTQTYLFTADILEQTEMDPDVVDDPAYSEEMVSAMKSIRSLSIVTDPDNLFGSSIGILANTGGRGLAWERPVSIEFIDPGNAVESFQTDAGLRMHGNGSRGSAKNSLRLLFRGDYGDKKLDYPLFGEDWVAQKFNTVVLRAQNANSWMSSRAEDRTATTFLQDSFAKDAQGAMGHPTAGSTFVHLFLNGTYWGMYNPTERPDGSFGEDHFGGDDADYDAVNRRFSVEVLSGTKTFWDDMITHSNTLLDTQAEYEEMEDYIDLDNLIDYMLMHQFMQARDGPDDFGHNNMRLVRRNNPSGPYRAYAWDMEYSMIDTTGTRDYDYPFPIYSSPRSSNRDITDSIASVYLRLKDNNPEFQLQYADRAYRHLYNGGAMSPEKASARFEERAMEIESAVLGESARWGDHRRAADPYTRDVEWATERNRINTEFFPARPDHVVSQLRVHGLYPMIDPPVLGQHGGEVAIGYDLTMVADGGTIYYSTDGSDPREAWTGSAMGMTYAEPIDLTDSVTVKARTLENGEWSALAEASFIVGTPADSSNLVISEIFYNPNGPSELLEFIELRNISSGEIDLTSVTFGAGIDFDFAQNTRLGAGEHLLVVKDLIAFETEYGAGLSIAGEFQNETSLANSGETFTLLAADGSIIDSFRYEQDLPWPTAADGAGYSLVLIKPMSNPDSALASSWRSSAALGGNPGATDSDGYSGGGLLEYAGASVSVFYDAGTVILGYDHEIAADDADLTLQWSEDLVMWSPLGITFDLSKRVSSGNGLERVEFISTPEVFDGSTRVFFRLMATLRVE
ncbi:lamin tail domain-containing protein [Akkermansiaceae bacterium]|nr:lamin tail domain-containing protein [Akkermansiaceae bacterium]